MAGPFETESDSGSHEAAPRLPIQTVPALRIGYAHRILLEIAERGPLTLEELLAAVDPEDLFKSSRQHRAPVDRARHLILFCRRLGLLADSGNLLELTDLGSTYTQAIKATEPWAVTDFQADLLRGVLVQNHTTDGVLHGAALLLSLLATVPDRTQTPTSEDAGRALAEVAGVSGWVSARTNEAQGDRFALLLRDMGLLDEGRQLTAKGKEVLGQLSLPPHPDLNEALDANRSRQPDALGSWLFQANPSYYDIRGAVSELREMNWTTAQSHKEIRAGDVVYLWEAGSAGGVLARGEVLTDPKLMPDQEGERFIRDASKFEGEQLRVRLRIDDVLDSPVGRDVLSEHPVLNKLGILRFANATNFKVSPEERDALDEFFEDGPDTGGDLGLQTRLEEILASYADARATGVFGSSHPVWKTFQALSDALNASSPVVARPTVRASWSVGRGNWARVPWVAVLDSRETTTTMRGVYPVWLFRQDMSGVYLTLAQGVTEPKKKGQTEAITYLQGVAQRVRAKSPELTESGFRLDSNIDLHADPGLGKDYEISTIAHKLYERGSVPHDGLLVSDLEAILEAYDRYVEEGTHTEDDLARLAAEFRRARPYPSDSDKTNIAAREEMAAAFSRDNLDAVVDDPAIWDALRFTQFAGRPYGGPGPQSRVHSEIQRGDAAKQQVARALKHVLYDDTDGDDAQRIDDVLANDNWKVYGLGESLLVKALAVVYPERWLPVFPYTGSKGKKRLAQAPVLGIEPLDETEFDTTGQRTAEANHRLREVLEPLFPGDAWAQGQFLYWLRDRAAAEEAPTVGLAGLAEELLLNEQWLEDVVELLRDKRQIIFYGPPGTGKTYVARKLAEFLARDPGRLTVVQFHPSYSYEDFVEGYRPVPSGDGNVAFELRDGPLRRMAAAADDSEADWCLLIDEINRGNIAKIFGELYYLLEYRDDQIELQYGGLFQLPKNLYVIGTMNTADRSIALLDAALRRRFHFVPFFPDQPPIDGLLRRWLAKKHPDMGYVADLVDKVNALLPDRHLQIGPSHFMTSRLTDDWLQKIWRGSVLPYIEEQFFDEPDQVKQFELERLLSVDSPASDGVAPPQEDLDEDTTPSPEVAGMGNDDG